MGEKVFALVPEVERVRLLSRISSHTAAISISPFTVSEESGVYSKPSLELHPGGRGKAAFRKRDYLRADYLLNLHAAVPAIGQESDGVADGLCAVISTNIAGGVASVIIDMVRLIQDIMTDRAFLPVRVLIAQPHS